MSSAGFGICEFCKNEFVYPIDRSCKRRFCCRECYEASFYDASKFTGKEIEILKDCLECNCETGSLKWKVAPSYGTKVGVEIPSGKDGYVRFILNRVRLFGHRVVWTFFHNKIPDKIIDHINGIRNDNRIANLREVTHQQNLINQKLSAANKSGIKGVSWCKITKKWAAHIYINYKKIDLGRFDKLEEAAAARKEASEKYFGEYARSDEFLTI